MKKQYYLPNKELDRMLWLGNFSSKINTYAQKYGMSGQEVDDIVHGSADFTYRVNASEQVNNYSKQCTAYKNALRDGVAPGATVQPPVPPSPGNRPVAVAPGLFSRIAGYVTRIKTHPAYSDADGQDLGIVGADIVVDFTTLTPDASIRLGSGGMPEIVWHLQDMEGIAIYKDSGSGFALYDLDNHPNWQDKHPLPAAGQPVVWKYKVIFRFNDEEVGQWSNVLSITVGS